MDRATCRLVRERIMEILKNSNDPILKNYNIACSGANFGSSDTTLKIVVADKQAPKNDPLADFGTDKLLSCGLAPAGTPFVYGRNNKKGTIIKARTKKYLFLDEASNQEMLIDFCACKSDTEKAQNKI
jgi:hypothetical protein